jgi:redox-sensitive bicupin YhaK (pirin superfamily)
MSANPSKRTVNRIETKLNAGPDQQVDNKNIVIMPKDPRLTDPFLMLAEDWFSEPGFEWHPHRGIETVTLVLDGVLEHGDNTGHAGALQPGDVQWMTAGKGIIHRELAFKNEHAHTLQLWLNLPSSKRMVEARYQDVRATERKPKEVAGARVDVISGAVHGVSATTKNHWPINAALITLEPNTTLTVEVPANHRAFAYAMDGDVSISGKTVREGQTAWSDPIGRGSEASSLTLATGNGAATSRVMLYSGQPVNEPIVFGGPFVMNSRAQINQAINDYHAGKFGQIPRMNRLKRLG